MAITIGILAIVLAVALTIALKAKAGVERPFARNWLALVGVTMTIMALFIAGVASVLTG
jgi:hypothetical protein